MVIPKINRVNIYSVLLCRKSLADPDFNSVGRILLYLCCLFLPHLPWRSLNLKSCREPRRCLLLSVLPLASLPTFITSLAIPFTLALLHSQAACHPCLQWQQLDREVEKAQLHFHFDGFYFDFPFPFCSSQQQTRPFNILTATKRTAKTGGGWKLTERYALDSCVQ